MTMEENASLKAKSYGSGVISSKGPLLLEVKLQD
jgi:hypothetical protein